VVTKVIIKLH